MSEALAVRAEIEKLARLLDTDPDTLAYLEALPATTVRRVRHRATDVLFDANADLLGRLATAAKLIPVATVALAGRRFFGPLLSARIAAQLDPSRASEVAQRLSPRFLAEVCLHLDPRRAAGIIARIPLSTIVEVARELMTRREYVTLGQLVGYVSDEAIAACVAVAGSEDLLRIAFFIEQPEHLDTVVDTLTDARIGEVLAAAAGDGESLWPYAFGLLDTLSPDRRARVAEIAIGQDDAVLASMLDAVHDGALYSSLLPLVAAMSPESRRRLAKAPVLHRADRLNAVVRAAADGDLWGDVLPLVELLPTRGLRHVATAAGKLDKPSLVRAIEAARDHDRWPALLAIAEHMKPETRAALIRLLADVDESVIESFVDAALADTVIERALAVLHTVPLADLQPVLDRIASLDPAVRQRIADRARDRARLDDLGPIGKALAR